MTDTGHDRGAEQARLRQADSGEVAWRHWGPYLSERAWGSVREDYSADGDAWANFPFEHARSRQVKPHQRMASIEGRTVNHCP